MVGGRAARRHQFDLRHARPVARVAVLGRDRELGHPDDARAGLGEEAAVVRPAEVVLLDVDPVPGDVAVGAAQAVDRRVARPAVGRDAGLEPRQLHRVAAVEREVVDLALEDGWLSSAFSVLTTDCASLAVVADHLGDLPRLERHVDRRRRAHVDLHLAHLGPLEARGLGRDDVVAGAHVAEEVEPFAATRRRYPGSVAASVITFTLGTTAPLSSLTVPLTVALTVWAAMAVGARRERRQDEPTNE